MAKKKLAAIVKIQIPAGQATPAPPAERHHPPVLVGGTGGGGLRPSRESTRSMAPHGKKYTAPPRPFDGEQLHDTAEALDIVRSLASKTFGATVDAAFRLGMDPR